MLNECDYNVMTDGTVFIQQLCYDNFADVVPGPVYHLPNRFHPVLLLLERTLTDHRGTAVPGHGLCGLIGDADLNGYMDGKIPCWSRKMREKAKSTWADYAQTPLTPFTFLI